MRSPYSFSDFFHISPHGLKSLSFSQVVYSGFSIEFDHLLKNDAEVNNFLFVFCISRNLVSKPVAGYF